MYANFIIAKFARYLLVTVLNLFRFLESYNPVTLLIYLIRSLYSEFKCL